MKTYTYTAFDSHGGKVTGEIQAASQVDASASLRQQGVMVSAIKENVALPEGIDFFTRRKISSDELELLTSELALLLNSGVTIDKGLAVVRRNSSSAPYAKLVGGLYDSVRNGSSLSEAMADQGDTFNALYINLVKLGESSGNLPKIFTRLAEDIKFQGELKRKIIQALTYPAVIFAVCILCVVFIFNYIVPQMAGLFADMAEIPTYTAVLLGVSSWMISYQWFLLLGICGSVAALIAALRTPAGARQIDEALLYLPVVKNVLILVERIRFNTAISMMLDAGILIDRSIEMAIGSVQNKTIRQDLTAVKDRVKKGEILSKALRSSPVYTDFAISLIEVGEESGDLAPVFNEVSTRARRDFESWVDRMTSLLEPILILTMGGIVGGVVVTMLLSIVSVNDIGF
jgi:type II secretory pathway component PulF